MAVNGAVKEKKKKKKKVNKEEVEANDLLQDGGHKNDASVKTVKNESSEINIGGGDEDAPERKRKRKKKKKTKERKEEIKQDVDGDILCHDATVKIKQSEVNISKRDKQEGGAPAKKKKKMKKELESLQEEVVEDGEHLKESKEKKRRKKLKTSVGEAEETKEEQWVNVGHNEEMESKKRKKKKKRKSEDDVTEKEKNAELDDGKIKKKRKKNKEINVNTGETDACEGKEQQKKKKEMKASKQTEEEKVKRQTPAEESSSSSSGEKKRKKLKKLGSLDQGHAPVKETKVADDVVEIEEEPVEKKRSKRDVRNKSKDKVKKTKLKEEDQEPLEESANDKKTDVVFLSEKRGNLDEISIDQARRLALQRDIDQESQPKPGLGQWGTAQFESSDRQAKFLRLLGGFKKSSQPITGSSGRASMALGKEAQKTLQQGLLGEFERAQSRNVDFRNKGAGLGFTEPSNKKFTIDVNARNAIRFDD